MTEQRAAIVVKPGTVSLDDLARVLAGAPVVLDPVVLAARRGGRGDRREGRARPQRPSTASTPASASWPSKRIPPDQTALLQRNLIVSHCCGVGAGRRRSRSCG